MKMGGFLIYDSNDQNERITHSRQGGGEDRGEQRLIYKLVYTVLLLVWFSLVHSILIYYLLLVSS